MLLNINQKVVDEFYEILRRTVGQKDKDKEQLIKFRDRSGSMIIFCGVTHQHNLHYHSDSEDICSSVEVSLMRYFNFMTRVSFLQTLLTLLATLLASGL